MFISNREQEKKMKKEHKFCFNIEISWYVHYVLGIILFYVVWCMNARKKKYSRFVEWNFYQNTNIIFHLCFLIDTCNIYSYPMRPYIQWYKRLFYYSITLFLIHKNKSSISWNTQCHIKGRKNGITDSLNIISIYVLILLHPLHHIHMNFIFQKLVYSNDGFESESKPAHRNRK